MINLYRITDLGMCLLIKVAFTSVLNVLFIKLYSYKEVYVIVANTACMFLKPIPNIVQTINLILH